MKKTLIVLSLVLLANATGISARTSTTNSYGLYTRTTSTEAISIKSRVKIDLDKYFIKTPSEVNIMDIGVLPEYQAEYSRISKKFLSSIRRNADWYNQYIKKYDGELPYHKNFGVTKKEYEEYLNLTKSEAMYKKESAKANISKANNIISIKSIGKLELIKDIEININNNTVKTPFGVCKFSNVLKASDDQTTTGRWNGYCWNLEETNIMDLDNFDASQIDENTKLKSISFYLGKLEKSKDIIIYFKVKVLENMKKIDKFEIITFKNR